MNNANQETFYLYIFSMLFQTDDTKLKSILSLDVLPNEH